MLRLYIVTLSLFSLYAVWNAMLDEAQAGIMTAEKNIYFCFIDYTKACDRVIYN